LPLPEFLVIGAPRCGTTALWEMLRQHPQIYMPTKEPRFYSSDPQAARTHAHGRPRRRLGYPLVTDPESYRALFAPGYPSQVTGEASPSYLRSPLAAQRIAAEIPGVKLIVILRHPVERAYSSYWFYAMQGVERAATFEQALAEERLRPRRAPHVRHFALGLYHAQLRHYLRYFPAEQIRVHLHEDWQGRPAAVLNDLFAFLGVDDRFQPEPQTSAVSYAPRRRWVHGMAIMAGRLPWAADLDRRFNQVKPPPMRPETRLRLQAEYRGDIERLQDLLGRNLSGWLESGARSVASP
jgi:Sulfotransferase family